MKVTRILHAEMNKTLLPLMAQAAFLRADIWRRLGGLGTVGLSSSAIRKQITALGIYSALPLDGTIRAETTLELVNCAYTSQMDSTNGLLQGKRVGDRFYCANGDVMQADHNAARNILARLHDNLITRFMPFHQVKEILLLCSSDGTDRQLA